MQHTSIVALALLAQQAESAQTALEQAIEPGQPGTEAMWSERRTTSTTLIASSAI